MALQQADMVPDVSSLQWTVAMIGSREHYAPARALHLLGRLELFYTDVWCRRGRALLLRGPGPARRLATRFDPELPADKVAAFNTRGYFDLAKYQLLKHASYERRTDFFVDQAVQFATSVAADIRSRKLDRGAGVFLGFKAASLETFEMLEGSETISVLDQCDAGSVHFDVLASEHAKWPGWAKSPPVLDDSLRERWEREWRLADVIFVNSPWTKQAIIRQGAPASKIAMGPLAYEKPVVRMQRNRTGRSPLRVLWLGNVDLGKGIQYFIEAARSLDQNRFEFTVVGPVNISQKGIDTAPPNMRFVGLVPRAEAARYYNVADVFVLPTMSDGFALTQVEAMAHGLPVVATPNCGAVVTSGTDGFIVPAGDSEALRQALERLEQNRDEVAAMSERAYDKAGLFTLENYARRLLSGVQDVLSEGRA